MQNIDLIEKFDIGQEEIFNTKMIAWLLNPKENHNYGSAFLEDFLFLINEKADLSKDITVETCYDMGYFGKIDILIETKESIYAIKCGNMKDFNDFGNIFSYKDYLAYRLKKNKKLIVVYVGVTPTGIDDCIGIDKSIKMIGYSEIAEILPDNLGDDNQQIIDYYSNIIQEKSAQCVCPTCDNEYITKWKKLHKYGKIVRQLAKYFNLNFTYKIFNAKFRRYFIHEQNGLFLLFNYEDNCLYVQIRLFNMDSDVFSEIVKQAENIGLSTTIKGSKGLFQEVAIPDIDANSFDKVTDTIKQSNIINNFYKLINKYDRK